MKYKMNKTCLRNFNLIIRFILKINRALKNGFLVIDNLGENLKEPFFFDKDPDGNFQIHGNHTIIVFPIGDIRNLLDEELEWCQYSLEQLSKIFEGYKVCKCDKLLFRNASKNYLDAHR